MGHSFFLWIDRWRCNSRAWNMKFTLYRQQAGYSCQSSLGFVTMALSLVSGLQHENHEKICSTAVYAGLHCNTGSFCASSFQG